MARFAAASQAKASAEEGLARVAAELAAASSVQPEQVAAMEAEVMALQQALAQQQAVRDAKVAQVGRGAGARQGKGGVRRDAAITLALSA